MRREAATAGTAVFFVAVPTTVAGVVPFTLTHWQVSGTASHLWPLRVVGLVVAVLGVAVLLASFVRFVSEGEGTPAPVAPTAVLVIGGLYRYVRNPMYVAVDAVVFGQALALGTMKLAVYGALVASVMAAFVHLYEEPNLERRFGEPYRAYRRAVPPWWPRLRAARDVERGA
jgi:protein-S-isoprenylcysteine O-methyltransferase Ste14